MKGEQITSILELFKLADQKKAVWYEKWQRHIPASVLQNMGARKLLEEINRGQVFRYTPKDHGK